MTPQYKGFFITLEGGEGAGKTTLSQALSQVLESQGFSVLITREPGGSLLSEKIRALLLDAEAAETIDARAELLLFLSARAQHVSQKILPALQRGNIVLCDRFHDSTVAYQGFARGLGADIVKKFSLWSAQELHADLTLYLDLAPEIGRQRMHKREGQPDRIEKEQALFHQAVHEGFEAIAQKRSLSQFVTIKANQEKDDVFQEAWNAVQIALQHKRETLC